MSTNRGDRTRGWPESIALAGAIVVTTVVLSVIVNPLIGRTVHWDIMAVLMPTMFVALTALLKKRWV